MSFSYVPPPFPFPGAWDSMVNTSTWTVMPVSTQRTCHNCSNHNSSAVERDWQPYGGISHYHKDNREPTQRIGDTRGYMRPLVYPPIREPYSRERNSTDYHAQSSAAHFAPVPVRSPSYEPRRSLQRPPSIQYSHLSPRLHPSSSGVAIPSSHTTEEELATRPR